MKAVILAGGRGTRLYPLTEKIPKLLVKIGEKPIIEHQILLLKKYGIKEIWVLLGYLGEQIESYLGTGKRFGLKINYCFEKEPLGTAGALRQLEKNIKEDFLVFSGDVMMDFNVKKFISWHCKKKDAIATLLVHPNNHPFDSDLVEVDDEGRITSLLKRPHPPELIYRNLSVASAFIFSPRIFKYIPIGVKTDFEKDVLPEMLKKGEKVYAYNTPEYLKDMGTLERLKQVRKDYRSGKISRLNLQNKRKAVFLDRDGVINHEVDQLSDKKDLRVYDFSARAVKKINDSDYLTIILTNQPMIAKGFMKESDLHEIHKKLETELGKEGAKIDAIYYCPHHPKKGFAGEIPELKVNCNCRKPKIGMFLKACKDFNIDLEKSYIIGDQTTDILAGKKAGCKTILVKTGYGGKDEKSKAEPDFVARNLRGAINRII
jgi:mannose-1-phosphate guanylyltransferase / phosphomannomutase